MITSQRFERIYNEIRLLMQAELFEAANHAIPELEAVSMTNGQIALCFAIEDFLIEKLDESEDEMDFQNATDRDLVKRWNSLHEQLLKLGRELLEMTPMHPSYGTLHDFYENTSALSVKVTQEMQKRDMFVEPETLKDEYRQFLKD